MHRLRSGTALFCTAADGLIAQWNTEAERLTGISATEAEGRPCWEVVAGRAPDGDLVCHPRCSAARLARQGWPVRCVEVDVPTTHGNRRLALSTIVLRGDDAALIVHTLHDAHTPSQPADAAGNTPVLTPRQREILLFLARGVRAREIAARLMLSETTVRNHIQSILLALGVHSQLEAVARAHELALGSDETAA